MNIFNLIRLISDLRGPDKGPPMENPNSRFNGGSRHSHRVTKGAFGKCKELKQREQEAKTCQENG